MKENRQIVFDFTIWVKGVKFTRAPRDRHQER